MNFTENLESNQSRVSNCHFDSDFNCGLPGSFQLLKFPMKTAESLFWRIPRFSDLNYVHTLAMAVRPIYPTTQISASVELLK